MSSSSETCFVHPNAIVETKKIGNNTRIWAFVHILPQAMIGDNCNICDHCFIENDVFIGNNVTVKSGIYIWDGVYIEDNVFLGPNVVFTNDVFPRSKVYPESFGRTIVKKGASIGANSVIVAGNIIGEYAMVGAGSVVTRDIPDYALAYGNPARIKGYVCQCTSKLKFIDNQAVCQCGKRYKYADGIVSQLII
ncbi:transferase hexapeptide (six repeat-containing protein) [Aneurinibacillus thermoaerophilus]|uniref:dTDP-3-amino-3,6-dideoxy-alpha-D-galactopyranose 3-N-acetyltransferase n=2 Tax=Aneurinibacillus thermoaerophilus TaxID=143495 RepID=FDTC_ANETH|nr:dTDP-3-amino-3,6-dideoxy-alpha-D-galactopyranose 3-N-acetyltransferase [Aneurinibacillus thermoaerophilus]Q6T1W7.1 RecName: Full=dTDP-3-amino-3,6-dideoxy-alpha-D-galactopyranose 3-N-acetyltransferase; AltName: Full=dTDP-D-Fucp3N acetylase [Aneurinibacillus thermoaerophilus]AAS55721.1 dTDP-D-Fucp3N acetylase [Aneurinibacillus thermoaerophilus]SDH58754.1 transferase hexapeptide (six repeat-containing protein) [Aneurinibacillus thermoaerophilus]